MPSHVPDGAPLATPAPRPDPIAPYQSNPLRAIGLMVLATVLFSCLDATAKYLVVTAGLPAPQVVWMRFVSQFALILLAMGFLAVPRLMTTTRFAAQMVRSFLMLASTALNFAALEYLRLDQTSTIFFLTPLVVALLAGPVLGEWVGWRRMIAILIGFCGILVAVRPGLTTVHFAMIFAIGAMLAYAVFILLTRYLTRFDPPEVTIFYSMIAGTCAMAPFAVAEWVWPTNGLVWVLLLSLGFWGGIGHYLLIIAHRYAPASVLAPFIYTSLLTHSLMGFLIFADVPDRWTLAGASIVICAGLYLLHRERVTRR